MTVKIHRCETLPSPGIQITSGEYPHLTPSWDWVLTVSKEATEADLEENHHLENVGDVIWSTVVGISHCPFCGVLLGSPAVDGQLKRAEVEHFDYSTWT